MKNISNFINEKLKITAKHSQKLPTWEEFVDALYHFPGKVVDLANFSEELEDAEVKDYPKFVTDGNDVFHKDGHIMELHADDDTPESQSIIIYFKYEYYPVNFVRERMWAKDYEILINSLGKELYVNIYNEMKEYYRD